MVRIPLKQLATATKWTVFSVHLPSVVAEHTNKEYKLLKCLRLCSNM